MAHATLKFTKHRYLATIYLSIAQSVFSDSPATKEAIRRSLAAPLIALLNTSTVTASVWVAFTGRFLDSGLQDCSLLPLFPIQSLLHETAQVCRFFWSAS